MKNLRKLLCVFIVAAMCLGVPAFATDEFSCSFTMPWGETYDFTYDSDGLKTVIFNGEEVGINDIGDVTMEEAEDGMVKFVLRWDNGDGFDIYAKGDEVVKLVQSGEGENAFNADWEWLEDPTDAVIFTRGTYEDIFNADGEKIAVRSVGVGENTAEKATWEYEDYEEYYSEEQLKFGSWYKSFEKGLWERSDVYYDEDGNLTKNVYAHSEMNPTKEKTYVWTEWVYTEEAQPVIDEEGNPVVYKDEDIRIGKEVLYANKLGITEDKEPTEEVLSGENKGIAFYKETIYTYEDGVATQLSVSADGLSGDSVEELDRDELINKKGLFWDVALKHNNGSGWKDVKDSETKPTVEITDALIANGYLSQALTRAEAMAENKDIEGGIALLKNIHDEGYSWAAFDLGYYTALNAPDEGDFSEAFRWYETFIDEIDDENYKNKALCRIGNIYEKRLLDSKTAEEYYTKTVDNGYGMGAAHLGDMYWNGIGSEPDYLKAMEWYEKSYEMGNTSIANDIGYMYLGGRVGGAMAIEWFTKVYEDGDVQGAINIIDMYRTGTGVEKNKDKVQEWIDKVQEEMGLTITIK